MQLHRGATRLSGFIARLWPAPCSVFSWRGVTAARRPGVSNPSSPEEDPAKLPIFDVVAPDESKVVRAPATPLRRSAYRRPKASSRSKATAAVQQEQASAGRRGSGITLKLTQEELNLRALHAASAAAAAEVPPTTCLLIDGYNIILSDAALASLDDKWGCTEGRFAFECWVVAWAENFNVSVMIAYDSSSRRAHTRTPSHAGRLSEEVWVAEVTHTTADSYLVELAWQLREADEFVNVIVMSLDRQLQERAAQSGAKDLGNLLDCKVLLEEMRAAWDC